MIVLVEKQKKRRRQVKTVLTRTGVATAPCLGECLGQHPGRFDTGKAHIQPLMADTQLVVANSHLVK